MVLCLRREKPLPVLTILMAALLVPLWLGNAAGSQDRTEPPTSSLELLPVLELPVSLTNLTLSETEQGYVLRCALSNTSNDQILGLGYQLLVLDPDHKTLLLAGRTESFKLAGYATKDLTFRTPMKLRLRSGDRVVLAVDQLISRESIWEVLNTRKALEAYGRGDSYVTPEVLHMSNAVDPKPQFTTIY